MIKKCQVPLSLSEICYDIFFSLYKYQVPFSPTTSMADKIEQPPHQFTEKLLPDILEKIKASYMDDVIPEIWSAAELEAAGGPQTKRSSSL
ncbi:hypothetical protein RHGRI_027276 [Rhododendron griersonianum]|uniref:Uncharacterized protein n=1 Tax=Rhododendron griersonianum TaxID=479676 RepID=A0AAV6J057_9ERIC|nr:hypothetical protein RHGRI_027276 [Rhododendron griersonianum]